MIPLRAVVHNDICRRTIERVPYPTTERTLGGSLKQNVKGPSSHLSPLYTLPKET